jgi:hypothetical protein
MLTYAVSGYPQRTHKTHALKEADTQPEAHPYQDTYVAVVVRGTPV